MNYSLEQLPNGRWGIYVQKQLMLTIDSYHTGLSILSRLQEKLVNSTISTRLTPEQS